MSNYDPLKVIQDEVKSEPEPSAIQKRSHQEIMSDMIKTFIANTGNKVHAGSLLESMFEVVTTQLIQQQEIMYQIMNAHIVGALQWTYPDGSKSTTKPKDGMVFRYITNRNGPKEEC